MHPAKSIIFFTTSSGAGFGLIFVISLLLFLDPASASGGMILASFLAVMLASAGLFSSLLHLGNPQRAWRALSQWQSSWLSREGVLAILTLGLFIFWLYMLVMHALLIPWLSLLIALSAAATVFATAMIYAQLRPVPRWHTALTPLCYLGFAMSSGGALLLIFAPDSGLSSYVLGGIVLAWLVKLAWWLRADKTTRGGAAGSSMKTATGLTEFAEVKLLERPHMTKNYLMKEMMFSVGRKHSRRLRQIAIIIGGILPVALIGLSAGYIGFALSLIVLASGAHLLGLLVERWLFFAEAEHVVGFYYGHQ